MATTYAVTVVFGYWRRVELVEFLLHPQRPRLLPDLGVHPGEAEVQGCQVGAVVDQDLATINGLEMKMKTEMLMDQAAWLIGFTCGPK